MNKRIVNALLVAGSGLALCTVAPIAAARPWGRSYTDYARVLSVQPRYRRLRVGVPHRQCRELALAPAGGAGAARDTVIGTIVGGVVGNQLGGGRGRAVATVAGAVLGAVAGSRYAQNQAAFASRPRYVRQCRTVTDFHTRRQVVGYRVTYRYHGRIFHTRMPYDPGNRLRVRVNVRPLVR